MKVSYIMHIAPDISGSSLDIDTALFVHSDNHSAQDFLNYFSIV